MVKAHRHAISSSSSSSSTATVQHTDPLRGVMATKEQVEIQMYLSKLKELVPHMPKNRKVSKLEVIQHVIDYICDLQSELEQNHPASLNRNRRKHARRGPTSDASNATSSSSSAATILMQHRQPLGLLASIPNTSIEVNILIQPVFCLFFFFLFQKRIENIYIKLFLKCVNFR